MIIIEGNDYMKLIPIGIENFKEMIDKNAYYVDKTKLIEQLLQNWSEVNLFYQTTPFWKNFKYEYDQEFF